MGMWVCVKRTETVCGTVDPGRTCEDGDPMLEGAEPGAFQRVDGGAVVEEATAEPGVVRRTSRK